MHRSLISLALVGLSTAASAAAPSVFQSEQWEEATPHSQGVDPDKLKAAVELLARSVGNDAANELVIIRNGRLIWRGDDIDKRHGVWSATKSFTSTVLGLLIEEGKCSLDTRLADVLPAMKDHYPNITLRHLTTMTSGYRAEGDTTTGTYKHGPSTTPFTPSPMPLFRPPGSQYAYWDSAMNVLGLALTKIAGEPLENLFRRRIADPIGMHNWDWGDYATIDGVVVNGGSGNSSKHMFITARDMARFGLLFLNCGSWNGRQLVDPAWIAEATRVQVPASLPWAQPESEIDGRGVYGFNWWVNGIKPDGQRKFPGAPAGLFFASGHNNNRCFVIPEWDMVIVRLGLDGRAKDEVWNAFLTQVASAITNPAPQKTQSLPLKGQIIVDPDHPQWLMRAGGRHVFICGPGDPEDFLYAGRRNEDGTRDGDQVARIEKLAKHGGNCVYIQLVRTHGGDAKQDKTQNPFVDSDPAKGLDEDILRQWDDWFAQLNRQNILIYLFFYDDSARIWNTGDQVGPEEHAFFKTIVQRYKHLKNLIWVIGEESEERYSTARVQALAQIIKDNDDHAHLIGDHHQTGVKFKAWQQGGALNHFAMQLNETDDAAHAGAVEALRLADSRYQIIYSESTEMRTDVAGMRGHAWAVAMGGLMPMLLRMDIATTPPEALEQCRYLQTFFEQTDFWTMSPHDELKHAETKYVLAYPGRSYIAYGSDVAEQLGLKQLPAGRYDVHWLDCQSGKTSNVSFTQSATGDALLPKSPNIGSECAAWIKQTVASDRAPPETRTPAAVPKR